MHDASAIILASRDEPSLFRDMKYLSTLDGRPLISRVVDAASTLSKEVLIIAPSEGEAQALRDGITPLPNEALCVIGDAFGDGSELTMIEMGLARSHFSKSLLLPGDAPFLSLEVLTTMLDLCSGRDAVVPRSPIGEALPFPAVYATEKTLNALRASKAEKASGMRDVLEKMAHVMFLSSNVLSKFDSDLLTFYRVDSPLNLKKAELILSGKPHRVRVRKYD